MNNMNKKTKTIIIIIVILVVLGLGIVLLMNYMPEKSNNPVNQEPLAENTDPKTQPAPENTQQPANIKEPVVYKFDPQAEAQREESQQDLKQMAFAISERFGSFSNQGNYGNINDLKIYMTKSMKDWADRFVAQQSEADYSGEYYGITTTALIGEITEFNDTDASVLVTTRRKEVNKTEERVYNQDIIINFKKVGTEWKVDGAYWQ